ncbi:MAG: hypothetical protein A2626_03470 [Candidatus Nealsonbacteria bacterium RIFCSPHIGHO2_01_FULL_38_55]|uniref:Leucine-binding protein domain-containing protein n=2 Tax=Parcubacteria group TaxID=1794811 RepID=A0A1G2E120_9BACT|nr:MAG: hypothetical protein A3H05_02765 [Candidatus Giovannonibacteria bacterium RIFCSPLOWO2_12_FULL_43_26]OGZ19564.1 MAG: hypothetical protein A2626_03470 [Candidatus Nealsonbacteria bacterium RIFCSPHIGHO2_01_FULL_38_55]
MKKIIWTIIIMVVMAGAVFFLGYKNSNDATEGHFIKIGALLPLSGNAANYGEGSREGIEIAKDDLKSKYLNLNIQVVYEDSFYDPKRAVDGYRKLKDISNISAILTGGSQISSAVKNLSDKDNVLQMAIWSGAPSYSSGVHNFTFRVTALADEHIPALVEYLDNHNYKKLALLYANNEFGVAFKESFENFPNKKISVVPYGFSSEDMDFRTLLLKVKNDKTDAIFFVGLVKQFVGVLKEANELGIKKKFFSQWSVEDQQLLDGANDLAEGIIYTYPFDYNTPYSKDFTFKYQQKYNKVPNGYVAESYVGTMLMGEAINACQNKVNVNCWKDYLDKIKNFPTIMGLVTMDSRGDIKAGKVFLKTVKDGKFVKLEE